jgi:2-polyprenyl-3-methyl-5-hydroxy-6-metoxy-1,4-benzoquinol methylase
MKEGQSIIEDGVIAGNLYNKYGTKNPIERYLMKCFQSSLDNLVTRIDVKEIHEVGCGEGHLSISWALKGKSVRGTDFSEQIIEIARRNAEERNINVQFEAVGIFSLKPEAHAADLILCCEVLEHLQEPHRALAILANLASPYLIASVPREPLWSILNMARGKYFSKLGNTPGHVQKWSKNSFIRFLSSSLEIIEVVTPIPWTMVLCRSRAKGATTI